MKRHGCSGGVMLAIISSFVNVSLATAETPRRPVKEISREATSPGIQDPIGWVGTSKVDCERIASKVSSRYGDILSINNTTKTSQLMVEEFKFIRQETCETSKYQICKFAWCSSKSASLQNLGATTAQDARAALASSAATPVEQKIQGVSRNNGSFHPIGAPNKFKVEFKLAELIEFPAEAKAPAAVVASANVEQPSLSGGLKIGKAKDLPVVVVSESSSPGITAPIGRAIVGSESGIVPLAGIDKAAEAPADSVLATLVKNKQALWASNIQRQVSKEKAEGINWKVIEVPGASNLNKSEAASEDRAGSSGTRVIAPNRGLPQAGSAVPPSARQAAAQAPDAQLAGDDSSADQAAKQSISKNGVAMPLSKENKSKIKEYQKMMQNAVGR